VIFAPNESFQSVKSDACTQEKALEVR